MCLNPDRPGPELEALLARGDFAALTVLLWDSKRRKRTA